ncbi:hypothetical protein [Streptomyces sp. Ru62]|nr:hypothetical protein [Streptomyces sp. Ru62]
MSSIKQSQATFDCAEPARRSFLVANPAGGGLFFQRVPEGKAVENL